MADELTVTPTFKAALDLWGGYAQIARAIATDDAPVQRQKVAYWAENLGYIPEEFALAVEEASRGEIKAAKILEESRRMRAALRAEKADDV